MGLSANDLKPVNISIRDAYKSIKSWLQANHSSLLDRDDDYSKRSVRLIRALPSEQSLTDLEIKAIISEVVCGSLEWSYHKSDGNYKMAAYAHAALDSANMDFYLSGEEKNELKRSRLWPFIYPNDY